MSISEGQDSKQDWMQYQE